MLFHLDKGKCENLELETGDRVKVGVPKKNHPACQSQKGGNYSFLKNEEEGGVEERI